MEVVVRIDPCKGWESRILAFGAGGRVYFLRPGLVVTALEVSLSR